ncbi:hypothetical protein MKX01_028065 [Papaver californicum]|nr:hypothetical protein MKX01_028065 [Papaver californicum]
MEKYGDEYEVIRETIKKMDIVDNHAHNLVSINSSFPFIKCFSEADGHALSFAPHTLSFKRSIRDIAELYGCEKSLNGIEEYRKSTGLESISSECFKAAKIYVLLIDDGLEFDKMHDLEWHKSFAPVVARILRIEYFAEKILNDEIPNGSKWTLDLFADIFTTKMKSYPSKFNHISPNVSKKDAEEGLFEALSAIRIQNKSFIDYIFTCSLDIALSFDLPIQIHTGFGDKDLVLRLSNPLHLRAILDDKRYSKCNIVLLHASYPFSREASYLASVYSQVYLDFGLAVPKLSVHGMKSSVKELLELAPTKKVVFSSDGYAFPEIYLGAKKAREVVASVLRDACDDGDLTISEAVEAAQDIFKNNAIRLYKLPELVGFSFSNNVTPHDSKTLKANVPEQGIVFVRVIFVDGSGKHRCRVIPVKRFYDVARHNGVGLTFAIMGMTSFSDGLAD